MALFTGKFKGFKHELGLCLERKSWKDTAECLLTPAETRVCQYESICGCETTFTRRLSLARAHVVARGAIGSDNALDVFLSDDYGWQTSKIYGVSKFLNKIHVIFETNAAKGARECDCRVPRSLAATAADVGNFASW